VDPPAECTVTVDYDNGDGAKITVDYGTVISEDTFTNMLEVYCIKDGAIFEGWTCEGQPFDKTTKITSDITIKAVYTDYLQLLASKRWSGYYPGPDGVVYKFGSWALNTEEKKLVHSMYASDFWEIFEYSYITAEKSKDSDDVLITITLKDGTTETVTYCQPNKAIASDYILRSYSDIFAEIYYPDEQLTSQQLMDYLDIGEAWFSMTNYNVGPDLVFDKDNNTIEFRYPDGKTETYEITGVQAWNFFTYTFDCKDSSGNECWFEFGFNQWEPHYFNIYLDGYFEQYTSEKYQK
ncbi:MAG: hypothetical protein HUJ58_04670, partial [Erysipelotrichaceae bacterium]|nr:hypothetical protein [Erysipelotrichaceae bacterium]